MYENNYQMPVMSRKDQALRKFFSQPKVLWLGIIGIVSSVLSVFYGLIPSEPIDLSGFSELGIDVSSFEQSFNNSINFSIPIIPILTAVAFLLFHFNAKNPQKDFKAPSAILNIFAIIGFVGACIVSVLVVLVLALVALVTLFNTNSEDTTLSAVIIGITFFILLIVFALVLLIAYVQMSFTKSLKLSTTSPQISKKGVKGFGIILMIDGVCMAITAITAFAPLTVGVNPVVMIFSFVISAVDFVYYLLYYQFVSGFGKIIEAEEATRLFESAPYNQMPHSQMPFAGEAFDNQRPYYNNPYTAQESVAEVVEKNICKNCGAPVNDDDYFCMKCGTRIERD